MGSGTADLAVTRMDRGYISRYPKALKYQIADVDLGEGFLTSRIEWHGESQRTAEELTTAFGAAQSKATEAEQLIAGWLDDGPILSDTLLDRAREVGISFATYRRVKEDALKCKAGQHKGRWYAWLPEHDHLWELMREQAVIVGDFQGRVPDSDAHLDVSGASLTDQVLFRLAGG